MTAKKIAHRVYNATPTLAFIGCLITALFTGCTTETRSFFFDGVESEPPPPTTRVRRDLLKEIDELQRELSERQNALEAAKAEQQKKAIEAPIPDAERAKTWPALSELLPKAPNGDTDWNAALGTGAIEPRVGLDPSAPAQAIFDLDIHLSRSRSTALGAPKFLAVTYRHASHTQWLTCNNCHPDLFSLGQEVAAAGSSLERTREAFTMAKIKQGEYCGACHGKVAFGVDNACERCHQGLPSQADWHPKEAARSPVEHASSWDEATKLLPQTQGQSDWTRALIDGLIAPRGTIAPDKPDPGSVFPMELKLMSKDSPAFAATFSHGAHTEWLTCDNCHTGIFQMQRGAAKITMAKIKQGEYCGACHGKVAFGVDNACERCHQGLPGQADWRPKEGPRNLAERASNWDEVEKLMPQTQGQPDWTRALADGLIAPRATVAPDKPDPGYVLPMNLELVPENNPAMAASFPHGAHTQWLTCNNCHTDIFQMQRGATPMTMDKIFAGEYCGVCHGKVAFSLDKCGRCHAAMSGGK